MSGTGDDNRVRQARAMLLGVTADAYCELGEILDDALPVGCPAVVGPETWDLDELLDTRAGLSAKLEQVVLRSRQMRARAAQQRRLAGTHSAQSLTSRLLRERRHELLEDATYAIALLGALDDAVGGDDRLG